MQGRAPVIALVSCIALGLFSSSRAQDGPYPSHTVRLLVSSAPGGNPDILGRLLAERMSHDFGQTVVVENVQGAGTAMVALTTAKAAPDGYTLMLGDTGNMAIIPALNPNIGYDPVKDFTPITALAAVPTILVANPQQLKARTLSEFIALAKQEPGKITYGSGGVGSIHHLTMAIFAEQTGIDVLHVPYRAGTAMVNGLLTGEIQVGWSGIPNVISGIASGQLRGYCISVMQRSPSEPEIPTCDELGIKGFDAAAVLGFYAPAGASPNVVTRLAAEAAKIMHEPAMTARMDQLGMLLRENGTASYVEFRKQDAERYANIVRKLNLHIN
jgi:tripartite-type tricarboxylate transporter receptor subunit TctC